MPSSSRQLIIGTAINYGAAEIEVFATSLRQSGYKGDVVLFSGELSTHAQGFYELHDIRAEPFSPHLLHPRWRHFYELGAKIAARKDAGGKLWQLYEQWLPINSARFIACHKFLLANGSRYDEFLFADVRDVFFQKNPFDVDYDCELGFFEEDETLTIGHCPYNSSWMKDGYGSKTLDKMRDYTVIYAGLTYARGEAVSRYTRAMVDELVRTNSHRNLDQGVHNFLARSGKFPEAKIFPQASSPILNIGCTPAGKLNFDVSGQLINSEGKVATVVHQYDRHPSLAEKLLAKIQ